MVRKLIFTLVIFCGVMLTGCTQLVDLSEEENGMITEYMAGMVLKYDVNYEDALIYPETVEEESENTIDPTKEPVSDVLVGSELTTSTVPTTSPEPLSSVGTDQSEEVAEYVNLSEVMGNSKFSIDFSDYIVCDSYPNYEDNNYFTLETSSDRQLLLISFDIKNLTDKKQNLNLLQTDILYQLDMNTDTIYRPMMTLLMNDIQYFNLDIAAGATKKAVIVFDVLRDVDLSNINLLISYQDISSIINIK